MKKKLLIGLMALGIMNSLGFVSAKMIIVAKNPNETTIVKASETIKTDSPIKTNSNSINCGGAC